MAIIKCYDLEARKERASACRISCGPGVTRPEFLKECTVSEVMKGVAPPVFAKDPRTAKYGDFSDVSFESAMQTVQEASEFFESLPSAVRDKFGSNVSRFVEWASKPENVEEGIKLGIFERQGRTEPETKDIQPQQIFQPQQEIKTE